MTRYHGRKLWTLKDGLGSTIALTNRGGNAVARIGYDAWGSFRWPDKPGHGVKPCRDEDLDDLLDRFDAGRSFEFSHDGHHYGRHFSAVFNPYLFTGRKIDPFSSLYNHRNRMMNPRLGRFISKDAIGFSGGLNLWAYARNNPLLYTDPFGQYYIDFAGLPYYEASEKMAWSEIANSLRSWGLEQDAIPAGIKGAIEYGGYFGQRLRDLLQHEVGSRVTFLGFSRGGSHMVGANLRFTLDSNYSRDPIRIGTAVFHEFAETFMNHWGQPHFRGYPGFLGYGGSHGTSEKYEGILFRNLFNSSWQYWRPRGVSTKIRTVYPANGAKAEINEVWDKYCQPGEVNDSPSEKIKLFYEELRNRALYW